MTTALVDSSQMLADHYDGPGPWWPLIPIFWLFASSPSRS